MNFSIYVRKIKHISASNVLKVNSNEANEKTWNGKGFVKIF